MVLLIGPIKGEGRTPITGDGAVTLSANLSVSGVSTRENRAQYIRICVNCFIETGILKPLSIRAKTLHKIDNPEHKLVLWTIED